MTNPNDQAVPIKLNNYEIAFGLTKREYFAALAMQGICSRERYDINLLTMEAIVIADALIEELNKESI